MSALEEILLENPKLEWDAEVCKCRHDVTKNYKMYNISKLSLK